MGVVLVLFVAVFLLMLIPQVQTTVARYVAAWASERSGAEVRIGAVAVHPFGRLRLEEVFVGDLHGDTLFDVGTLRLEGLRIHPRRNAVKAAKLSLEGGRFALATASGAARSNLTELLDRFSSDEPSSAGASWTIEVASFAIGGLHFSYHNSNSEPIAFGVDFEHVEVRDAVLEGHHFRVAGDSITAHLEGLSLVEQSGLQVERLSGATTVSGRGIQVEQMQLATPRSQVQGELHFITEGWSDYQAFNDKVLMRLDLDSSRLDFADIAFFAPDLEGIALPIGIAGRIRGTVSDLKGRDLNVHFGTRSFFRGSADLTGLPDLAGTFMVLDIDDLLTGHEDLARLPMPPFTSGARLPVPDELTALGNVAFSGSFTGFLNSFTAYGRARTALGDLRTDLSFRREPGREVFSLSGRAATDSFVLGPIIHAPAIGAVAANIRIQGSGRDLAGMVADLEGSIPVFTLNGTPISGITVNGRIQRDLFNGSLSADDPAVVMDFSGLADLRGEWPEVDFKAHVQHADLSALGLVRGHGYSAISLGVAAEGRLSPDSLKGFVTVQDIFYCDDRGDHELGDIHVTSGRRDGANVLEMVSSFADVEVVGDFLPTRVPDAVASILYSVFPALSQQVHYEQADQDFRFTLTTKDTGPTLDLFFPGLSLDPGGLVTGELDTRTFSIGLEARLPGLRYGRLHATEVDLVMDKALDILAFSLASQRQTWGDSLWFAGTSITGKAYQDDIEVAMGWDGSSGGTNGELDVLGEVRGPEALSLALLPSTLYLGRGEWRNPRTARFELDTGTVRIDSLVLYNAGQRVALNGFIGPDTARALAFEVDGLRLENFTPFLPGPELKGSLHADGRVHDLLGAPFVISDIAVDSLAVKEALVGDLRLAAEWADGERSIALRGDLMRGLTRALGLRGELSLERGNPLDLDLAMDRFDLAFIDPYLPEGISDIQGEVSGDLRVTGDLVEPQVNGDLDLVDAGLRIDYLNTLYRFSDRVTVRPDMFALDFATVRDEAGNTARMGATILHRGLRDWNFNAWGTMDRLQVLNTGPKDNSLYYGTAYAIGDLEVSGYLGNIEITVDARTAAGTDIHFPIGGSTEVSPIGFVRFAAGDTLALDSAEVDLSGIALDMNVQVTPDAHFELIFDPTVGDILSGRGRGNMEMTVGQSGDFSMRGQVEVSDGEYLFTLRNVINKRFQIQPGGRIVWYGDPFDAYLDMAAIYRVRAPLYDIMFEKNEAYRRRVPVDVVMNLRDKMLNPEIGFNVRLPSVDEAIRTQVNSVLSTEQEMNRQVFALIVLNRFVPPPAYNTGQGSPGGPGALAGAGTSTSELLSNQVSNWLSRLSNEFDLGVNYRPGDDLTQDELELAVSTQLFDERLLVSTNVGVQYGAEATRNNNTIVGDFQLEYLLTNDGKLRLKAFSVSNDRNLNRADQALTTQGAGVAFREEFDTWGEFWQKMFNLFRSKEHKRRFDR